MTMKMTDVLTYIMFLLAAEETITQVTFFRLSESAQSGQSEVIYNVVTIIALFHYFFQYFFQYLLVKYLYQRNASFNTLLSL